MNRALGTVLRVTGVVLVLDLVTKVLTVTRLEGNPLDLGWVTLRSARNTGISFSIGAGAPTLVVTLVTGVAVLAIAWFAVRGLIEPPLAAGLLLGGGLGNFIDRLDDGAVVDMVDLGWFPVFNVADIALNLGVAVVLLWGLTHTDEPADDDDAVAPAAGRPLDDVVSAEPLDGAGVPDEEPTGPPPGGA